MRCSALSSLVFLAVAACGSTSTHQEDSFAKPNELMGKEIENRIAQIPYQHRDELFNNLLWLSQRGETAIPALLEGLEHREAKVRSNCAWVLGQIHDRRVIPYVRELVSDANESVRLEAARTLIVLGDVKQAPVLIEGLDSEKIQVRYLCHEALKSATGRDFQYDHLGEDAVARSRAVYRWRRWWSEQSGDKFFAEQYAKQAGIDSEGLGQAPDDLAMPGVETAPDAVRNDARPKGPERKNDQPDPFQPDGAEQQPERTGGETNERRQGDIEFGPANQPGRENR